MKRIYTGILLLFLLSSIYVEGSESPLDTNSSVVEMVFVKGGTF